MNYFSRIAKQSGLRFTRGNEKERQLKKAEPASKSLSPLEVDETIIVAPSQADHSDKSKRQASRLDITGKSQIKLQTSKQVKNSDLPDVAASPAVHSKKPEKEPEIIETELMPNSASETVNSPREQTASALSDEQVVVEPAARKQTISKETKIATDPAPEVTERVLVEAEETKDLGEETITHDVAKKDYFIKTAEIIERGNAEPAEIHQILLREVQQWAADSPNESGISEVVVERPEPKITKQIVSPHFEQTQLIGEQNVSERKETSGLAEQTFELSIGTINVVIEDEKPKQPEPAPRPTNQNAAQPAKREFSRLSRHYL